MKDSIRFIIFLLSLTPAVGVCEYRVYQYLITNTSSESQGGTTPLIEKSTLDPVSYVAYHGGKRSVHIELLRTWRCLGHTGSMKNLCSSPVVTFVKEGLK